MLLDDNCEILYQSNYGDMGKVGFRVKVPHAEQMSSGESVLQRANRYHNMSTIHHATPVFAPLYTKQHSVLGAIDPIVYDKGSIDNGNVDDVRWVFDQMGMDAAWSAVYGNDWVDLANDLVENKVVAMIDDGFFFKYEGFSGTDTSLDTFVPQTADYTLERNGTDVFPYDMAGHPEMILSNSFPSTQWFNWGEILLDPTGPDGIDDDGNGMVDDYFGWDFVGTDPETFGVGNWDNIPFPDPMDNPVLESKALRAHGTQAAAIVGALPNNDALVSGVQIPGSTYDLIRMRNTNSDFDGENSYEDDPLPAGPGVLSGSIGMCPSCRVMPIRVHAQTGNNAIIANDIADVFYAGRSELAILYAAGYNQAYAADSDPLTEPYSDTRADVAGIMIALEAYDPMFHMAIKIARKAGVVLIGSSGNNGLSMDVNPYFPNVWPEVLAVGSSEFKVLKDDGVEVHVERRQYEPHHGLESNYGWALDVTAHSSSLDEILHRVSGANNAPYSVVIGMDEDYDAGGTRTGTDTGTFGYGGSIGTSTSCRWPYNCLRMIWSIRRMVFGSGMVVWE
jgi:hypothetical protein